MSFTPPFPNVLTPCKPWTLLWISLYCMCPRQARLMHRPGKVFWLFPCLPRESRETSMVRSCFWCFIVPFRAETGKWPRSTCTEALELHAPRIFSLMQGLDSSLPPCSYSSILRLHLHAQISYTMSRHIDTQEGNCRDSVPIGVSAQRTCSLWRKMPGWGQYKILTRGCLWLPLWQYMQHIP